MSDSDSCPSSPTGACITLCVASDSEDECHRELDHNQRKSVQFSRFLVVHETWCNDEYDRTSMEPARLNFKEYSELLQFRCDLRREMEKMIKAAAAASGDQQHK